MFCKYSTDDDANTVENLPIFADARRNWYAKQKQRSTTSATSVSSIVSNVTTLQRDNQHLEYNDILSIVSDEYPYDN